MQTDPVGYEDQMNLYAYVHNDPMNYTDPYGLSGNPTCSTDAASCHTFTQHIPDSPNPGGPDRRYEGEAARQFVRDAQNAQERGASTKSTEDGGRQGRFAVGVSGTIFDAVLGGRGAFVVGMDAEGKFCLEGRMCALVGLGLETSIGGAAQVGSRNFVEGENKLVNGVFLKGGAGPVGGVFISDDGAITVDLGAGGGAAGGGTSCLVTTRCLGGE